MNWYVIATWVLLLVYIGREYGQLMNGFYIEDYCPLYLQMLVSQV